MPTIQLSAGFDQSRSSGIVGGKVVNMYSEKNAEGAKYPFSIYGCAGLTKWLDFESAGIIQGMQLMGDFLYVVFDGRVYKISQDKTKIFLGVIDTSTEILSMSDNGFQVIIITSTAGYIVTESSLTQITDSAFPLASTVTFFNSYFIVNVHKTGQFNWSAPLDGLSWDSLDFATAEKASDYLLRVFSFNDALWLFGERTIEIYVASNDVTAPFEPLTGSTNTVRGCGAKLSVAGEDNTLFWLGNDKIVYRAEQYSPKRISNHAIEKIINDMDMIEDAFAFVYNQDGHKFYTLTFPTENKTICYDIATDMWHERESFNLGRWRPNTYVKFAGLQLFGDFTNGKIYYLDPLNYTEDGDILQRYLYTVPVFKEKMRGTFDSIWLDIDSGIGLTSDQGSDPQISMQYSDDGAKTWSQERALSMGKIGEYKTQIIWRRCGLSRERIIKFLISDPVPFRVIGAYADITLYFR